MRRLPIILLMLILGVGAGSIIGCRSIRPKEKRKLVIIGIDAGTWTLIKPLLQENKLPNLQKLIEQGSSGPLTTFKVTKISPVLWASILTGKKPEQHGITGFISARGFPVNSTVRKVKDLAELLSEAGYSVGFVGFWSSWPAEKVSGEMVSDLLSLGRYKDTSAQANAATMDYSYLMKLHQVTYPEELLKEIYPVLLTPKQVPREDFSRLALFNDQEWERFENDNLLSREDVESLLKFSYVSDLNFERVALYLAENKKPEALAVYFEGADIVGHFFWKYMEPQYFSAVPAREVERFHDTYRNYYQALDGFIGQLMKVSGPDTAFLIISDHGMIRVPREGLDANHSGTHARGRPPGIFIFSGPGIKKSAEPIKGAGLLDITPTVLYYLGLPVAEDMPGKVLTQVFSDEFLAKNPLRKIRTYDRKPRRVKEEQSPLDQEIINKLRSLGYVR